jgi:hypothetical protein
LLLLLMLLLLINQARLWVRVHKQLVVDEELLLLLLLGLSGLRGRA